MGLKKTLLSCHLLLLSYCCVSSIPFLSLMAGDISVFHTHLSFFVFFFFVGRRVILMLSFLNKTLYNMASDVAAQRDPAAKRE